MVSIFARARSVAVRTQAVLTLALPTLALLALALALVGGGCRGTRTIVTQDGGGRDGAHGTTDGALWDASLTDAPPLQPQRRWAVSAGSDHHDESGGGVAVDSAGNVYVTGWYRDVATFGAKTLHSKGVADVFVAKLSPHGKFLWVASAGGAGYDRGQAIAVDKAGNSYVTGHFSYSAAFGARTLSSSGGYDLFVAKLSPGGTFLWAASAGGANWDDGRGIAVDSAGNSHVTGWFSKQASFGTGSLSVKGGDDVFVAKLSPAGAFLWAVSAGGLESDSANAIALDGAGNSHVTGCFRGAATFGAKTLTAPKGNNALFVARLSPAGKFHWAAAPSGGDSCGLGVAVDGAGNAYVAGSLSAKATLGSSTLAAKGGNDLLVARLSSGGAFLWARAAGGTDDDRGNGVAVDGAGNAYVTGFYSGTASFGSGSLASKGGHDVFVTKLSSSGAFVWAGSAGGSGSDDGRGIAVDRTGGSHVTGAYRDKATFDAATLTAKNAVDIFVWRTPGKPGL